MPSGSSIIFEEIMSKSFYQKSLLKNLPDQTEVFIIGGGIAGAGVFRDLSLHNVPCVLIDKNDFTSQTSQSSSKMLHGGIRYLENLDFGLVWEALHEKNLWLKLTPHLTYPEQFFLPVYPLDCLFYCPARHCRHGIHSKMSDL